MTTETIKISTSSVSSALIIDRETQEEVSSSQDPRLPYRSSRYRTDSRPGGFYPWHWHDEAECFMVVDGALRYSIPGEEIVFRSGDVGFLNIGVLHMARQESPKVCMLQNHIFLPELICADRRSPIWRRYIEPLTGNRAARLIRLEAEHAEAAVIRRYMEQAQHVGSTADFGFELVLRGLMTEIWLAFLKIMPEPGEVTDSADSIRLKLMLSYIRQNLSRRITLRDLATAAHISERECERCFLRQIGVLPFDYLLDTRLDRARRLLADTSRPVTEIALQCGFSTASYFTLCFRRKFGITPRAYRQRQEA